VEAAQRVGAEGQLVVVDIQPEMIAQVERRVRAAGLANVETHVASAYDLPLADASVDRAFLITVLPEIPDRARALAELRRVLRSPEPAEGKPGGVLSITEEFLDPDYLFACETIRLVEAAGLRLEEHAGNFWLHTLNFESFRKREA
jgi:ubiquinone/menaquinone biosynthesis C-methylase UbiE